MTRIAERSPPCEAEASCTHSVYHGRRSRLDTTFRLVHEIARQGADLIELGVHFLILWPMAQRTSERLNELCGVAPLRTRARFGADSASDPERTAYPVYLL